MIQVYAVNISGISQYYDTLYAQASPERKRRADSCRSRQTAACHVTAEALVSYAAKQMAGLSEFNLETGKYGKPRIRDHEQLHFNLSHSGHWVVLAWGNSEVGIDVEISRTEEKMARIARRFFAQAEQQAVFEEEATFSKRFLEIWTAKESYLKYLGTGLQKPLNSFDVCTMAEPRFVTCWLEDACVTLCTTEDAYQMQILDLEVLVEEKSIT